NVKQTLNKLVESKNKGETTESKNLEVIYQLGNHCLDGGDKFALNFMKNNPMKSLVTNVNLEKSPAVVEAMKTHGDKIVKSAVFSIPDDKKADLVHKVLFVGVTIPTMDFYNPKLLKDMEFLDNGKLLRIDKFDLGFKYRTSLIKRLNNTVLSVAFNFPKTNDKTQSKELIKYYTLLRQKTQPKGNSCGSVFTNPENLKAGYLIEQAGLKGYSVNKAKISTKHANFIITEEGATATDVCNLINYVKTKVKEKFNVELTEEIEYVGEF
ncbi:MAG: hypothetical protein J6R83_02405, partial [Clostridia bacterium]|nr:hypothetical protein [Clostridia bacterium]